MLISLVDLINKYKICFKGILHVGAHECEELNEYEKFVPITHILWVEGLPDKVEYCKNKYPNVIIEQAVVSDKCEVVKFNRSNNGQSSSILELGLHKNFHPEVHYVGYFETETKMLKDIVGKYYDNIPFNFINLDIQGAELKALKGMEEYLKNVDYIYTEVNSDYVYEGCCIIDELDNYLEQFDLVRVETKWWGDCKWGDAFYIKKNIN